MKSIKQADILLLLPWLPAPVSTCCNLTVVGWRLLAHLHGAIRWETNELSQDTGDNTRVLDTDAPPPHVNQPATVSFPYSVSVIVWFTSVLLRRRDKEHRGKLDKYLLSNCFFLSFAVYGESPYTNQALIAFHHSCIVSCVVDEKPNQTSLIMIANLASNRQRLVVK